MTKSPTSIRLSETADQIWNDLAVYLGISKASVLEQAIRKMARAEGLPERSMPPGLQEKQEGAQE